VRGIRNRHSVKVLFCTADGEREFPVLEAPEWMFDPVVCGRLERGEVPRVDCGSLRELQTLLDSVRLAEKEAVLEDQHHFRVVGGADAKEIEVPSVRVVPTDSPDSGGAARGSSEDDSSGGADAAPARRTGWRSPSCPGGES
jgi:hypothetical protein